MLFSRKTIKQGNIHKQNFIIIGVGRNVLNQQNFIGNRLISLFCNLKGKNQTSRYRKMTETKKDASKYV